MTHLVAAACLAIATAASAQTSDPDTKELAAYRLSMDAVNKVATATRAMVGEIKRDPRYQEALKLDADIQNLEKKTDRTPADETRLDEMKKKKESLAAAVVGISLGDAQTLGQLEAKIRKSPPMMAGLKTAALAPREYALCMMSVVQASIAAGMRKAGMLKDLPPGVSPENVKFVEDHEAELKALQKEFQALGPGH
jgi:hypothetical protein